MEEKDEMEVQMMESFQNDLDDLVKIPGGEFLMGSEEPFIYPQDGEGPLRKVHVNDFYIEKTEVTNEMFEKFVEETGWKTDAEEFGWSFVFEGQLSPEIWENVTDVVQTATWWARVWGADWRHPEGQDSSIQTRKHFPVVHISWRDANEFCRWRGRRLPTEAEWEFASRGGKEGQIFMWGNDLQDANQYVNVWQGRFPAENTVEDGYAFVAPAVSLLPNSYGLYHMCGNVWEWTMDWFTAYHSRSPKDNPKGPQTGKEKVQKGGSFMCHPSYCFRFRPSARIGNTPDSSSSNVGFRCAMTLLSHG